MRTAVYIDGFNLYYRALSRHPEYKWIDVAALARALLPDDNLSAIKYFTARIKPDRIDKTKHVRQQVFLRALQTRQYIQIVEGTYLVKRVAAALYEPWCRGEKEIVHVVRMIEKGSDVNLAAHLLADAFTGEFDIAAVCRATPIWPNQCGSCARSAKNR